MKDIRHALSDEKQEIVKTVHGRGYIFDREVRDSDPAQVTTYTEETAGVQLIIEEEEETNGAEVILAGACIVRTVMGKLGMTSLTVSDRGVRHGLLVDRFQT